MNAYAHQRGATSSAENGPKPPSSRLNPLRANRRDEPHPSENGGPDRPGDLRVGPARGSEFVHHPHVPGGDVLVEVVAGAVPLLGEVERRVAEEVRLASEQLRIEMLEQREHEPLLRAEVIVDLAQRHAGRSGHLARG